MGVNSTTPSDPAGRSRYLLASRDKIVVAAALELLQKVSKASFTSPAQLASVARGLHVLGRLPSTSEPLGDLTITLTGPRRQFGEHSIWHYWAVHIEEYLIEITTGGGFYRDATGSDSFSCLQWSAQPGEQTDYDDYTLQHWIVDDAQPFPHEVAGLDLNEGGFRLEVIDDANPLLSDGTGEPEVSAG
jgi:hypothetical protein